MKRRRLLGGISSSFAVGTIGGCLAGAMGTGVIMARNPSIAGRVSYAHQGEDLVLDGICKRLTIDKPTYLDIGAFDPVAGSNTYLFYLRGCRGVLVEPNPSCCDKLRAVRPGDTVLNAGIGPGDQSAADYYMFPGFPESNTFSNEQAEALVAKYGETAAFKVIKMPLLGINRVISEHLGAKAPDILSTDTEGLDLAILRSLDFSRFRPAIVCAEVDSDVTKAEAEVMALMRSKGYSVRALLINNAIFVDERRWK
jgi:FkbM family methyltransferase